MLAGIRSGRLGEVLGEFAGFTTVGVELRRRLWLKLAYPVVTLLLTLAVFAFVGIFVLPQFQALYREAGYGFTPTDLVIIQFAAATAPLWPGLALIAGTFAVAVLAGWWLLPAAVARGMASAVPLIGGVWRWTAMSEFCHLLAILLEHQLPLPEALRLAGEGVQHDRLAIASRNMADGVEAGQGLGDAAARRRELPPGLSRLLRWGEERGALASVLHMAGELFAARASARAAFAATLVSFACFFLVLAGVSLIVVGLVFPLMRIVGTQNW